MRTSVKLHKNTVLSITVGLLAVLLLLPAPGQAYQLTDRFAIGGILAGAYQWSNPSVDDDEEIEKDAGALPVQLELSFTPFKPSELFAKIGFAGGNGVNATTPFNLAPWAADLEDDVKDINGSGRDHLLTAWYKHTFEISEDHILAFTGGLIDSTDYLDENAYSNDEFTQFMNEALVNAPSGFMPSYDWGAAVEWDYGFWGVKAVYMRVSENDAGNSFDFYALQASYALGTSWGKGNYRIVFQGTSSEFIAASGDDLESRQAVLFSFDQEIGQYLGAWVRLGFQTDDAVVNYSQIYSGGLNINGKLWGRDPDNIGIGYGYLTGGNNEIENTNVAEAYYRLGLTDFLALTFDLQYMQDAYQNGDEDLDGFILGLRGTIEF